jgi:hypothetical protein
MSDTTPGSVKMYRPLDAVIGGAILAATGTFLSTFDFSLSAHIFGFILLLIVISLVILKAVLPTVTPPTASTARQSRNFTLVFTLLIVFSALSPDPWEGDDGGMQLLGLGRGRGSILFGVVLFTVMVCFLFDVSMHLSSLVSAAGLLVAAVVNPYTSDVVPCGAASSSRPL